MCLINLFTLMMIVRVFLGWFTSVTVMVRSEAVWGVLGLLMKKRGIQDIVFDIWMKICDASLLFVNMNLVIKYCNESFVL